MPGPPADPNSRKSKKVRPGWRQLPANGRQGEPPAWPLLPDPPIVLLDMWADLWRTPQAAAWEELEWTRGVALFALSQLAAEHPDAPVTMLGENRQRAADLGLTPMGMKRLEWQVGSPDLGEMPDNVTELDDYRDAVDFG